MVSGELNVKFQEVRASSYSYGIGSERETTKMISMEDLI